MITKILTAAALTLALSGSVFAANTSTKTDTVQGLGLPTGVQQFIANGDNTEQTTAEFFKGMNPSDQTAAKQVCADPANSASLSPGAQQFCKTIIK